MVSGNTKTPTTAELVHQFNKALFDLQNEIGTVSKNAKGYGYTYADLPEIQKMIQDPLKKHEFTILHKTLMVNEKCILRTFLRHLNGLEEYCEWPMPVKDEHDPQAYGSSETYGRRYNIANLLNLLIEEDDDGSYTPDSKQTRNPSNKPLTEKQLAFLKKKMGFKGLSYSDVKEFGKTTLSKEDPRTWTSDDFNKWLEHVGE